MIANSARIQLANVTGIQRVISIREDVRATIDCSLILDAFTTTNGITAAEVTLQWLSRRIVSKGEFEENEKIVSESVDRYYIRANRCITRASLIFLINYIDLVSKVIQMKF